MNTLAKSSIHPSIWKPIAVGSMHLPHRLAMAPMTRSRAEADGTPSALDAEYFAQRASLGLLITGGVQPSTEGQGYLATPGIYTDAHVAGWRRVADGVHARGGRLFIQLMHAGRIAHPDNTPNHHQPVGPSAITPDAAIFTPSGMQAVPTPHALPIDAIRATVEDFAFAAERAIEAGVDGVEIHAANGYLIQQFFAPNANQRDDGYGGDIDGRIRFALEVAAAVAARIGPERTGIRLSPATTLGGIDEGTEGPALYRRLVARLAKLDLTYVHLVHTGDEAVLRDIRASWPNALLVNRVARPLEALGADIEAGLADIAPIASWAVANPDLVERLRLGAPLNEIDQATLYAGAGAGYTDYPTLAEAERACA